MNEKKRKLSLLPEVLPAPQPIGNGGPRQRTLRNLRRLAAAAGAAATIQGCRSDAYGEGDPIVPPARCAGLAASIQATVEWTTTGTVLLKLGQPNFAGATYVNEDPTIFGGVIVKSDVQPGSASIELQAARDYEVQVIVYANCPAGTENLVADISVPMIPDTGTIPVRLIDTK